MTAPDHHALQTFVPRMLALPSRPRPQDEERSSDDSKVTFCISYGVNDADTQSFTIDRKKLSTSSVVYSSISSDAQKDNSGTEQIIVSDVDPWIFSTFHSYVEKDRVELGAWEHEIPGETISTPNDPTRWSWSLLADCYIFSETSGAPGFRQRLLEIMQTKYYQKRPVVAGFPPPAVIDKIYSKTQRGSPVRRLLAYMRLDMPGFSTSQEATDFNKTYHHRFLSEATAMLQQRVAAATCAACFVDSRSLGKKTCTSTFHSLQCLKDNAFSGWCLCHEHDNDEDKEDCQERRKANEWRFMDATTRD
ncbi:hypothetical protein CKM354_000767900 [Cercospora kikuchii]|uniref:BTB domain-containing protein n=1 Tax=Cercospora kikuchii TaxID=84275 RepID=A0A9P3CN73_9PEZI|nr:uncharacterized protein CKM354_000767900 [Cercospora kikuchii]GIZ44482.1 hypothetical protein CKM354_000767900 [Cercospora kikuchii]